MKFKLIEELNTKDDYINQAIKLGMSEEDARAMVNNLTESVEMVELDSLAKEIKRGDWGE